MKLGLFTQSLHALDRSVATTYLEDRDSVVLADKLGYVEAFIVEHMTDPSEPIASSLTFIAWLLSQAPSIRFGTGMLNLPNHRPASLAATIAMVDHLSAGRLILGVRPDRLLSDPEASTNFDDNRSEMFAECINQLLEIWSTEASYRIEGKYWKVFTERAFDARIGEGVMLKPFQRPHPPIVVTAIAPHSSSVFETAKRGWELLSSNFAASWIAKSHWSTFVAGCEAVGRRADPLSWRVAKSIFVADDMKTAKHYATDPSGPYRHYFSTLMTKLIGNGRIGIFKSDPDAPDSSVTVESVIDRMVIYGTPTKVADDILANQEEIGEFGTLLYAGHDWVDRRLAVRSMELMADEVMPLINKSQVVVATTTHADSGETYM